MSAPSPGQPLDAIFFDVDGVLIDSMGVKGEAFADTFPEKPHMRGAILNHHAAQGGVNRIRKLADLHIVVFGREASPTELEERIRSYELHVEARVVAAQEMPGAGEALAFWSERVPMHAVSASPGAELHRILAKRGIASFFKTISGYPPEKHVLISNVLTTDGLDAKRCVLVGDSRQDLAAANRTGLRFVQMAKCPQDAFVNSAHVITDLRRLATVLEVQP